MRKTNLLLIFLLLTLGSALAQQTTKPKWRLLLVDDDTISYIHTKKMITKQGTVRIWVKLVRLKDEDKGSKNVNLQKYINSAHALVLWEFNCKGEIMKMISLVNYSDEGESSTAEIRNRDKWQPIPPESTGEAMMRIACKK